MKKWIWALPVLLLAIFPFAHAGNTQDPGAAQKRILMERGEKVMGDRLELVKRVIESYQNCEVLTRGNEIIGLRLNGKLYPDFSLVIREAKRTIIVATPDGVVTFDY